jgi:hypothetical protein
MAYAKVDKSIIENKIAAAIRTSMIQFPCTHDYDVNSGTGGINWDDCAVLMAASLDHGRLWSDMLDPCLSG